MRGGREREIACTQREGAGERFAENHPDGCGRGREAQEVGHIHTDTDTHRHIHTISTVVAAVLSGLALVRGQGSGVRVSGDTVRP